MGGYAVKPLTPFITSKALKRTPPSETGRAIRDYIDAHDFSISIDEHGNVKSSVMVKSNTQS